MFQSIFRLFFRFLIIRSRRNAKPVTWKAPHRLIKRQLPWTTRELSPHITEIRGRSSIHYRSFDLIFDRFRVSITLCGSAIDEIQLAGRDQTYGSRIDHIQKVLAVRSGRNEKLLPSILDYGDLDEFLKKNHDALNEYYSYRAESWKE